MATDHDTVPETKVLAIASHVTYGYVGNTMATFVMQALGCEVSAINTVHFSNHTGYKRFRGTRTPAEEISDLYDGLKQSSLTDFSMLLSGYIPSRESLNVVAHIARDLRFQRVNKPGSFFWVLDPVMGDQGRLYVSEELVEGYKAVVREADLILPNQFEAEVLTGVKIGTEEQGATLEDVAQAIGVLHKDKGIKHVIVTSVRVKGKEGVLCVVGSTAKEDGSNRLFLVEVPVLDCYFSGTGDMFAALLVARLREACSEAGVLDKRSWVSDDDVDAADLPLAKATCKVLSSMQLVLEKTMIARNAEMEKWESTPAKGTGVVHGEGGDDDASMRGHLASSKAAEVRVVRNVKDLIQPEERYIASGIGNDGASCEVFELQHPSQ